MNDFQVSVKKLTDEELMREACESTFLGKSKASLLDLYKAEHSPVRTQMFWITLKNVKLFVSTHLLRHHVGSVPFQLTCRDDRKGGNPGLVAKCNSIANNLQGVLSMFDNGNDGEVKSVVASSIEELEWIRDNTDRNTKVTLSLLINAQSLIDMAKLRLCLHAHEETRFVFDKIKTEISKIDPALSAMMVRKCVYRGGLCGEMRCCGFNHTTAFSEEMLAYVANFNQRQIGRVNALCKK